MKIKAHFADVFNSSSMQVTYLASWVGTKSYIYHQKYSILFLLSIKM